MRKAELIKNKIKEEKKKGQKIFTEAQKKEEGEEISKGYI